MNRRFHRTYICSVQLCFLQVASSCIQCDYFSMFSVQCDYVVIRCFLHWLILGDVKCAPEHFSNDAPGGTLALCGPK